MSQHRHLFSASRHGHSPEPPHIEADKWTGRGGGNRRGGGVRKRPSGTRNGKGRGRAPAPTREGAASVDGVHERVHGAGPPGMVIGSASMITRLRNFFHSGCEMQVRFVPSCTIFFSALSFVRLFTIEICSGACGAQLILLTSMERRGGRDSGKSVNGAMFGVVTRHFVFWAQTAHSPRTGRACSTSAAVCTGGGRDSGHSRGVGPPKTRKRGVK